MRERMHDTATIIVSLYNVYIQPMHARHGHVNCHNDYNTYNDDDDVMMMS